MLPDSRKLGKSALMISPRRSVVPATSAYMICAILYFAWMLMAFSCVLSSLLDVIVMAAYWPPAGAFSGTLIEKYNSIVSFGVIMPVSLSSVIQSTI